MHVQLKGHFSNQIIVAVREDRFRHFRLRRKMMKTKRTKRKMRKANICT